jgi:hypothetical protein
MLKQTNINVKNVIFTLITTTYICKTNTTNQTTQHITQTTERPILERFFWRWFVCMSCSALVAQFGIVYI